MVGGGATRGQYDFTDADRIVDFAARHGQAVRGHTLVWHLSLPDWLTTGGFRHHPKDTSKR